MKKNFKIHNFHDQKANRGYDLLWIKIEPLLRKAIRKDFVLHTKMVVRAMKQLLKYEQGDSEILIPAAYLHDIGWSEVEHKLQRATDGESQELALRQHIDKAPALIDKILKELNFEKKNIARIIDIVKAHKFAKPLDDPEKLWVLPR